MKNFVAISALALIALTMMGNTGTKSKDKIVPEEKLTCPYCCCMLLLDQCGDKCVRIPTLKTKDEALALVREFLRGIGMVLSEPSEKNAKGWQSVNDATGMVNIACTEYCVHPRTGSDSKKHH